MKCYGYTTADEEELSELNTVSVVANPAQLRDLAQFLLACAKDIEADPKGWEHEHLKDNFTGYDDLADFVVCNDGYDYD